MTLNRFRFKLIKAEVRLQYIFVRGDDLCVRLGNNRVRNYCWDVGKRHDRLHVFDVARKDVPESSGGKTSNKHGMRKHDKDRGVVATTPLSTFPYLC